MRWSRFIVDRVRIWNGSGDGNMHNTWCWFVDLLISTLSILNSHCQMYCSKYEYHSTMFCQPAAGMNGAHPSATSLRNGMHVAGMYALTPVVCVALLMAKNRRSDHWLGARERSGDVLGGEGGG